jgi:ribosomal protein S18 acetylase RimI-like enzyme
LPWLIQPLDANHVLQGFASGEPQIDSYLLKYAMQNSAAGLGRTFVAVELGSQQVRGYFTMAAGSVRFDTIPDHVKKRLPRYPIPTAHLAKLGVDSQFQGRGLGAALLIEAFMKAALAGEAMAVFAIDVIAINDKAKAFYLKYGFVPLLDNSQHLYLHINTAIKIAKAMRQIP